MDIDRYIRLCASLDRYIRLCSTFNEEYLSNYDAKLEEPLIWFREWYVGRLYWI